MNVKWHDYGVGLFGLLGVVLRINWEVSESIIGTNLCLISFE